MTWRPAGIRVGLAVLFSAFVLLVGEMRDRVTLRATTLTQELVSSDTADSEPAPQRLTSCALTTVPAERPAAESMGRI